MLVQESGHSWVYFVSGMWCSTCAKTVQDGVAKTAGVASAEINFSSKLLFVRTQALGSDQLDAAIRSRVEAIGFGIRKQSTGWIRRFAEDLRVEQDRGLSVVRISLVWFLAMWSSTIAFTGYLGDAITVREAFLLACASAAFGVPAILIGIVPYARSGLRALVASRLLTLDLFIFLGGLSAVSVTAVHLLAGNPDSYADSGSMVIAVLLLAKKLENSLSKKVSNAILFQINPVRDAVQVLKDGGWTSAEASQVRKGDRIRVAAGETVGLDGVLESDEALFNCHLLNGEDLALRSKRGADVLAGSIALSGAEFRVTAPLGYRTIDAWAESALVAGGREHPYAKLFSKLETTLTSAALIGALSCAAFQMLKGNGPGAAIEAFFIGVLVFCPCLFATLIPLSKQMVHLSVLKMGALIHRTEALFDLPKVDHVYLDKTGTLVAVESYVTYSDASDEARVAPLLQELVMRAHHPILKGLKLPEVPGAHPSSLSDVKEIEGQGVSAVCADGSVLRVGSAEFVLSGIHQKGGSVRSVYPLVALGDQVVGQVVVKSLFDSRSKAFIEGLMNELPQAKIDVLSGDPRSGGDSILEGLDRSRISYRGGLTPDEKARSIEPTSLFIGDGLNDTPALARADVSCRVGNRVAGFAPVDLQLNVPDLSIVLSLVRYARRYRRILAQTACLAFTYNVIALGLAFFGIFSPIGAVLAMFGSFLLLTLSSLRLLKT